MGWARGRFLTFIWSPGGEKVQKHFQVVKIFTGHIGHLEKKLPGTGTVHFCIKKFCFESLMVVIEIRGEQKNYRLTDRVYRVCAGVPRFY